MNIHKLFLTFFSTIFLSSFSQTSNATNNILEDLKNYNYPYTSVVLNGIEESLKKHVQGYIDNNNEDLYAFSPFNLNHVKGTHDNKNWAFYLHIRQYKTPHKSWHKLTYEEYKEKVIGQFSESVFRFFNAFGEDTYYTHDRIVKHFFKPLTSGDNFKFFGKIFPTVPIIEDNKFIFFPEEEKNRKASPVFLTEEEIIKINKMFYKTTYIGLTVKMQKVPVRDYDYKNYNKYETCMIKYRLDAKYSFFKYFGSDNKETKIRTNPIPIETRCY